MSNIADLIEAEVVGILARSGAVPESEVVRQLDHRDETTVDAALFGAIVDGMLDRGVLAVSICKVRWANGSDHHEPELRLSDTTAAQVNMARASQRAMWLAKRAEWSRANW